MKLKFTLLTLCCAALFGVNCFAQGQGVLLSNAKYDVNGTQKDSIIYFYSGDKAKPVPKYAKVPEYLRMDDSSHRYIDGALAKRTICTYTGSNEFSQSITYTYTSGTWRNEMRVRMVYKTGKPDTVFYDTWSTQGSGSWRLSSCIVYSSWNGNDVLNVTRYTRSFGRNAKWNNDWKTVYSYAGGNIKDSAHESWSNNAWVKERMKKYTWTSGKLTQVDEDGKDASSNTWKPFYKAVYTYDANGRVIDIKNDANDNAGGWKPYLRDTMMYISGNTTSAPDTIIRLDASTGNYVNQFKIAYQYKSNSLITRAIQYSWNGTTAWVRAGQDTTNTWNWGAGVSVNDIAKKSNILNVYPSPASNELHITLDGIAAKKVEFVITDMQGRAAKAWNQVVNGNITVDITALPAGNYVLMMNDGTQKDAKKFAVSK